MFDRMVMLDHFMEEDLKNLASAMDQCFETLNMLILWKVLNCVDEDERLLRKRIVSFFCSDFGAETGQVVADLLLGPQDEAQTPGM